MLSMPPATIKLGVAGPNRLGREHDRLQAGAAHLVDGVGRDGVGQPGLERRLPRRVLADAGLQDVAHDDFVDLAAASTLARLSASRTTTAPSCGAASVGQVAEELADGRTGGRQNDGIGHGKPRLGLAGGWWRPMNSTGGARLGPSRATARLCESLVGKPDEVFSARTFRIAWRVIMPEALLHTTGLTKSYGGPRPALEDLNLTIAPGEIFGLLGPNGSGKSTALRLLLGFMRPSAGSASVAGLDCWTDSVAVRRRVAYLPGELRLYESMTGRQLVRFLGKLRNQPHPDEPETFAPAGHRHRSAAGANVVGHEAQGGAADRAAARTSTC